MLILCISLALLGLAAIDPIGIAAMPILLLQKHPYSRSLAFLGGSFASLMLMGLVLARGFGTLVLRFEKTHSWLIPSAELIAALFLLAVAITLLLRMRTGKHSVELSESMASKLKLRTWYLFVMGAVLVALQSCVDVVFVIAMVRAGQLQLSNAALTLSVAVYALAALIIQGAVVLTFRLAPVKLKAQTLGKTQALLSRYANVAIVTISLGLSLGLLISAAIA